MSEDYILFPEDKEKMDGARRKHGVSASFSSELLCETENFKLPCDIELDGGGKISKGCRLSTLILALENRIKYERAPAFLCEEHGGIGFVSDCKECNT